MNVTTEATFSGEMVSHVLNRGVGRRLLFTKDEDFLAFERVVEEMLRTRRMRVCAYCLMPNHWHFVVWPVHPRGPSILASILGVRPI